jgi:hypothetical protein
MLQSFFSKSSRFGYNFFFPSPYIHPELRGLSGEEYDVASLALDERYALDKKYSEECRGLHVFFQPHHPDDPQIYSEQCFERLGKIAEERGMDTIAFAKSLGSAHEFLTDYISQDDTLKISSAVGDEWGEVGKIETFFKLLEEGLTLPTSYEDILALHILKSKDENTDMHNVELTLDDVKKYMGTPEFNAALDDLNQEVETSISRKQNTNNDFTLVI